MKVRKTTMLVFLLAGLMCVPVADSLLDNEAAAQPKGPKDRKEKRKEKREDRKEKRKDKREDRKDKRDDRKEKRKDRREDRKEKRKDRRETRKERRKNWREKRRTARRKRRAWAAGARKAWIAKRVHRRRVARNAFLLRWGAAVHKVPAAKKELGLHAYREARFERLRYIAETTNNEELLKKIDELEDKEDERHDAKMEELAPDDSASEGEGAGDGTGDGSGDAKPADE
jgi:hypothetical protein